MCVEERCCREALHEVLGRTILYLGSWVLSGSFEIQEILFVGTMFLPC